ncbi:MAG: hypothetical protein EA394_03620, partial [Bacteroidia bacterium]
MKVTILFTTLFVFLITALFGQDNKIPLDHSVYDDWKQISRAQLSNDGRWASWEVNPQRGDGLLHLLNLQTSVQDSMARGTRARFSPGSDYMAFLITPEADSVRQAKVDGKKRGEMPKDVLGIYRLHDRNYRIVENVASFSVPDKSSPWMAYHLAEMPEDTVKGRDLYAHNPITETIYRFPRVTDYLLSDNGQLLVFEESVDDEVSRIHVFRTGDQTQQLLFEGEGNIRGITVDEEGKQVAFLFAEDTEGPQLFSLFLWRDGEEASSVAVTSDSPGVPAGWGPSEHRSPQFTSDGKRVFFGTAPLPEPQAEDTLLPEEKHRLDVWHYRDPLIQPMQLVQADREK